MKKFILFTIVLFLFSWASSGQSMYIINNSSYDIDFHLAARGTLTPYNGCENEAYITSSVSSGQTLIVPGFGQPPFGNSTWYSTDFGAYMGNDLADQYGNADWYIVRIYESYPSGTCCGALYYDLNCTTPPDSNLIFDNDDSYTGSWTNGANGTVFVVYEDS